jgi:hypothetical protein
MSALAQACATHSVATNIGGMQHPAMPQTVEELAAVQLDQQSLADGAIAVVIDAETFWHSLDNFEDGCQAKALCAFTGAAAVPTDVRGLLIEAIAPLDVERSGVFSSRESAPDTPPPRWLS